MFDSSWGWLCFHWSKNFPLVSLLSFLDTLSFSPLFFLIPWYPLRLPRLTPPLSFNVFPSFTFQCLLPNSVLCKTPSRRNEKGLVSETYPQPQQKSPCSINPPSVRFQWENGVTTPSVNTVYSEVSSLIRVNTTYQRIFLP